jgi:CPA2 family monovalent cation:H+ antiporter-2
MTHLPPLIEDLAIILIVAALTTLVFKRFRQPVVLGYLLAGLLVGPHVPFFPGIDDIKSVNVWAEIGIIFLLFGLGLEFSFKKLAKVGKSAAIAALFEIITMTGTGYLLGQALDGPGWTASFWAQSCRCLPRRLLSAPSRNWVSKQRVSYPLCSASSSSKI